MDDRTAEVGSQGAWAYLLRHVRLNFPVIHPPVFIKLLIVTHRTDTPLLGLSSLDKPRFTYPTPNSSLVADILPILSTAEPKTNLAFLSSFRTRYYNSDTGKASSEWLLQKIRNYTEELGSEKQKELISVEPFKHTWKQTSIVRPSPPQRILYNDV